MNLIISVVVLVLVQQSVFAADPPPTKPKVPLPLQELRMALSDVSNNLNPVMREMLQQEYAQTSGAKILKEAIAKDGQDCNLFIIRKYQEFAQFDVINNRRLAADDREKMLADTRKSIDDAMTAINALITAANAECDKQLALLNPSKLSEVMKDLNTASIAQYSEGNKAISIPRALSDNLNGFWAVFEKVIDDANSKAQASKM